MEPEELFAAAVLAVGPPARINSGTLNRGKLAEQVREYNAFMAGALGRTSVTTRVSYAVFALWYQNKYEYRKLVKLWKENEDVMLPFLRNDALKN